MSFEKDNVLVPLTQKLFSLNGVKVWQTLGKVFFFFFAKIKRKLLNFVTFSLCYHFISVFDRKRENNGHMEAARF